MFCFLIGLILIPMFDMVIINDMGINMMIIIHRLYHTKYLQLCIINLLKVDYNHHNCCGN